MVSPPSSEWLGFVVVGAPVVSFGAFHFMEPR
jgi:hypothetical protein